MTYQPIEPISREQALLIFATHDADAICDTLIRLVFHDPDGPWVEQQCLHFAHHNNRWIRRAAVICFGHLARIHGAVTLSKVIPLLNIMQNDPFMAGVVDDVRSDIQLFIGSKNR